MNVLWRSLVAAALVVCAASGMKAQSEAGGDGKAQTEHKRQGRKGAQTGQAEAARLTIYGSDDPKELKLSWKDEMTGGIEMYRPFRATVDNQNRILVTEPGLGAIDVFDPAGRRWQFRGDKNYRLIHPTYIAVDDVDNIYVCDMGTHAVVEFSPLGRYLRTIGEKFLSVPTGLAIDREAQRLYVADLLKGEVQVYGLRGPLEGFVLQSIGGKRARDGRAVPAAGHCAAPWGTDGAGFGESAIPDLRFRGSGKAGGEFRGGALPGTVCGGSGGELGVRGHGSRGIGGDECGREAAGGTRSGVRRRRMRI